MQENFDYIYKFTRAEEGGDDDDPRDPGGRTSRGIIQSEYNRYHDRKGLKHSDVWKATEAEILEIYVINYWQKMSCAELPSGIDMVVFDSSVLNGTGQTTKWLQRAVNRQFGKILEVDGAFGEKTKAAVKNVKDVPAFVNDICDQRLEMLKSLRTWPIYGRGWSSRVKRLRAAALGIV